MKPFLQVRAVAPDRPEVLLQEHPGRRLRAPRRGAPGRRRRAADGPGGGRGQDRGSRGSGKGGREANHGFSPPMTYIWTNSDQTIIS